MKILLVEDSQVSIDSCIEYAEMYVANEKKIEIIVAHDLREAFQQLKDINNIDVAIIDIKLGDSQNDGNDVINEIQKLCLRIPAVAHTGTPDDVKADVLKIFVRGEENYGDIFDYLLGVYNTGITEILGKNGFFETNINRFYKEIFLPSKDIWIDREKSNPQTVKNSLLRQVFNNLTSLLMESKTKAYSEEFYTFFLPDSDIHTGSIYKNKDSEAYYLVVSPACDIFPRKQKDGSMKRNVDRIHLLPILENPEGMKNSNKNAFQSNTKNRFHYLPKIDTFDGGFVDFADITVCNEATLKQDYEICDLRIADSFMKNISSRFAAYFSRQGQPDLCDEEKDESKN